MRIAMKEIGRNLTCHQLRKNELRNGFLNISRPKVAQIGAGGEFLPRFSLSLDEGQTCWSWLATQDRRLNSNRAYARGL